jgi:hypothetical protein
MAHGANGRRDGDRNIKPTVPRGTPARMQLAALVNSEIHTTAKSCGTTFIAMVHATDFRVLNNISHFSCLNGTRIRRVLL